MCQEVLYHATLKSYSWALLYKLDNVFSDHATECLSLPMLQDLTNIVMPLSTLVILKRTEDPHLTFL